MRAIRSHQPKFTLAGAEKNEVLAEQSDPSGLAACLFLKSYRQDRNPVLAKQISHKRAGTDKRYLLVFVSRERHSQALHFWSHLSHFYNPPVPANSKALNF